MASFTVNGTLYQGGAEKHRSPPATDTVDCETAALMRAVIRPLFDQSATWAGLMDRLATKGYVLAFRDGRLCLTDSVTGRRVCGLRFLGMAFPELVERLGRPVVAARPGHDGDGELLREPPFHG